MPWWLIPVVVLTELAIVITVAHKKGLADYRDWRYGNLFSFRVWWIAAVGSTAAILIPTWVLVEYVWSGFDFLIYGMFLTIPAALLALMAPETPSRCDACGKRVKLTFDTCHHCGHKHGSSHGAAGTPDGDQAMGSAQ